LLEESLFFWLVAVSSWLANLLLSAWCFFLADRILLLARWCYFFLGSCDLSLQLVLIQIPTFHMHRLNIQVEIIKRNDWPDV